MIHRETAPIATRKKAHQFTKSVGTFAPAYLKSAVERHVDSAAEAAFGEKKWVWVKDGGAGFLRAWVKKEDGDNLHVRCTDDSDRIVKRDETDKVNPPKFDKVQDMASLTYLNEPSVAYNLQQRFEIGSIYTYSGLFLVAVNPYRVLPIYGKDTIEYYKNRARDEVAKPHVFATSDLAFRNMLEMRENQSILVTGESGAGKTENTKKVISYLAGIASQRSLTLKNSGGGLEEQILQANPILEAFGNAQTVRNDNSSRFGKFIRIHFSDEGHITGANINWFLLEKSRVATQTSKERNYHVFYQLLAGATAEMRSEFLLHGRTLDYEYLKKSRMSIPGVSDAEMYRELVKSFEVMGIPLTTQKKFFSIVASILHIGNLEIDADRSDQARITDLSQVEKVCHLLGISVKEFIKALLTPRVKAGREWVVSARSATQVKASLAALARSLYERNFGALVDRINESTERPGSSSSTFIAVLDMAGFEIFERNSFEQLCINYTNEKLQQFFNHHMFVLEQDEYAREQIDWKFIDFGLDLQPTIELIEKSNPIGVLSCLDEECVMPRATDITFTEKLHHIWQDRSKKYRPARFPKDGFVVTHYAAEVEYTTEGWLEKNKDPLNDNVSQLLARSTNDHVAKLFSDSDGEDSARVKKGLFRTVAQRHKEQLSSLMDQLHSTQPHFVRCIIPNHEKSSRKFDFSLVLDQLRCNGVLEGIRIARTGFPNRLPFAEFRQRYSILAPSLPSGYLEGQKVALQILEGIEMDKAYYRIGLTKVFFRAGVLAELEERREAKFRSVIAQIQALSRGYMMRRLIRKRLHRKGATLVLKHDFMAYLEMCQSPWWQLFMKMKPVLSATKSDREMKLRSSEIVKLEALAKEKEKASQRAFEEMNKAEMARKQLEETLKAERLTALDKEELYERSRTREAVLQEDLDLALADVDTLEGRCDELLNMKRDLEAQIDLLRSNVDQGSMIAERLLQEKLQLNRHVSEVEASLNGTSIKQLELESVSAANVKRLELLQGELAVNETELQVLRKRTQDSNEELSAVKATKEAELERVQGQLSKALLEKKAAQDQLDALISSTSTNTLLIRKKDSELTELRNTISRLESIRSESLELGSDQNVRIESLSAQVSTLQLELTALKEINKRLEVDLAGLTKAASSEEVADFEKQISQLRQKIGVAQKERLGDQANHRHEIETKSRQAETYRLAVQKLEVINGDLVKQIAKSMQEKLEVKQELKHIMQLKNDLTIEMDQLKARLVQAEASSTSIDHVTRELRKQLLEAQERAKSASTKASQVDVEKERFRREAMDMRAKFDELVLQRTSGEGNTRNLEADLQTTNKKLKSLFIDNELLMDELNKTRTKLDHVNRLDEDLVATQVRDVTIQRDALQVQLQASQVETQKIERDLIDLKSSRSRFTKELEDLNHELDKEHQIAKAAEKMTSQLQRQVIEVREQLDLEKQAKVSAQASLRRLQASYDDASADLIERTSQVLSLYRAVTEDDDVDATTDWHKKKVNIAKSVELAKQLETARTRMKQAESSKAMAEAQLEELQKRHQDLQEFESKTSKYRLRSESVSKLDIAQRPGSPSRPATAPWTPPQTMRIGISDPGRSRTNTLAQNFENRDPLYALDSGRLDSIPAKRIQALQYEVDSLQKKLSLAQSQRNSADKDSLDGDAPMSDSLTVGRLMRENKRLHELLDDNAEQVDAMEAAQRKDKEFLKNMQTKSMAEIEETFQNLADDKIALTRAQRKSLAELEGAQQELDSLRKTKSSLQESLRLVKIELEEQISTREQDTSTITQLEDDLNDAQTRMETEIVRAQELTESVKVYRQRAEEYFDRLEQAESTVIKATHAESWAKKQWKEAEEALKAASQDRQSQDAYIIQMQRQIQTLEIRIEDDQLEISQASIQRSRLQQELEQYRDSKGQELDERDFEAERTRKAYQRELASLSSELESERSNAIKLREDNRVARSNLEELQAKWNEDNLNAATWEKEAQRKDSKLIDLSKELQSSEGSLRDAQSRVVNMLSEIRELRLALEDVEAEKESLTREKKALDAKCRSLTQSVADTRTASHTKMPSSPQRELALQLQEKEDYLVTLTEKMQRADAVATEAQREVDQERETNVELHRQKVALENEKRELQLRVVDLETKSYSASFKDVKFLQTRIAELEKELQTQDRAKLEESRTIRTTDRTIKELESALSQREVAKKLIEERASKSENRMQALQKDLESLRDSDSANQLRARRAERDAADQRERALRAEKELERYKSRDELNKMSRSNTMNKLSGPLIGSVRSESRVGTLRTSYQAQR